MLVGGVQQRGGSYKGSNRGRSSIVGSCYFDLSCVVM